MKILVTYLNRDLSKNPTFSSLIQIFILLKVDHLHLLLAIRSPGDVVCNIEDFLRFIACNAGVLLGSAS